MTGNPWLAPHRIAKAMNDGRAIKTTPGPDPYGKVTAWNIIGWGCLGIAAVCFACLVLA